MKVSPVKKGTAIGYGTHVAGEDGVIAVLPIGYGDGFPTQSSGFDLIVNGETARVFGRVNMDMAFLFFKSDVIGKINVGDEVRFWEKNPKNLINWATHMNTHAYQALCGISARVPRVYRIG
jgi:alanine racemase